MKGKSKLFSTILVTMLLISISLTMVVAQYTTQTTTPVTIGANGNFTAQESSIGVSYSITGAVGATGSVTADSYSGNPQSSATIPSGISLTHFVVLTFNMSANDFSSATVTLTYSDADVQNLKAPFAVYKYDSNSNSYVELPSTIDSSAKTITVTLNSLSDPLLAIGGATAASSVGGISIVTWVILIVAIIVILLVAVYIVRILTRPNEFKTLLKKDSTY